MGQGRRTVSTSVNIDDSKVGTQPFPRSLSWLALRAAAGQRRTCHASRCDVEQAEGNQTHLLEMGSRCAVRIPIPISSFCILSAGPRAVHKQRSREPELVGRPLEQRPHALHSAGSRTRVLNEHGGMRSPKRPGTITTRVGAHPLVLHPFASCESIKGKERPRAA